MHKQILRRHRRTSRSIAENKLDSPRVCSAQIHNIIQRDIRRMIFSIIIKLRRAPWQTKVEFYLNSS